MPVRILLALVLVFVGLIVAGVALVYPPAGLITAGVLGLGLTYASAYVARKAAK